ncbi:carbohydrate esterase family 5 protein [Mollisia scopiformis]|uniref:Carbohydrate esterase family 5 protein n=1 Tax=Mollisia scopiformis TaxID=149040 RepID=A0A194X1P5_MOLSC|nr:carbohydrate esterase family 5 protein [Mollisia scopiformis]KUJ13762.1 carbohydrate esterase family 5 protein [Mollisia scopiformis]
MAWENTCAAILFLLGLSAASPVELLEERQSGCPNIHIFGARETTAPAGYGTAGVVVNLVLGAYSGSTAEAINYPACGGQSSCGGDSYSQSVAAGVSAVVTAVNGYAAKCPSTQLVLVGYSQGSEIFDVALCGGGDPNQGITNTAVLFSSAALANIKAAVFMGDPLYHTGLPYNVGTCAAGGFDARPSGFTCPNAAKIQSYCDATDPYCCNGNDANTHQGYGTEYGQAALKFIEGKLSSSTTTPTSSASGGGGSTSPTSTPTSGTVAHYGQCGGTGWTGATTCAAGYTCKAANAYYSQCL